MATEHPEVFAALAAEFNGPEVRTRNQAGRQLSYITARTAMNRFDAVLGPENWQDAYTPTADGLICTIKVRVPGSSEWISKSDGGAGAGMAEADNEEKSAFSDAFKRAAVKFGVARYLYRDGVPNFLVDRPAPPEPSEVREERRDAAPHRRSNREGRLDDRRPTPGRRGDAPSGFHPPRTGRALFAWVKKMEQEHQVGLLKYLNGFGKLQDFSGRVVDWSNDQVAQAYAEGCRKLDELDGHNQETEEALAN